MLIVKLIAVFLMGAAVGILYRIPRGLLMYASLNAAVSWLLMYGLTVYGMNPVAANFFGSILVGAVAEVLARRMRKPSTIFIIPGFIPLVPGREAFTTMRYLVEGQFVQAWAMGALTIFTAGAIAFGIFVSATVFQFMTARTQTESGMSHVEKG